MNSEHPIEPRQPEHYASHLAAVDQSNAVVSTEDIFNSRGALVVRKGTRISPAIAERILQHRLTRPLHDQVELSSLIDNSWLRSRFAQLFSRYADLGALLTGLSLESEFSHLVLGVRLPPVLAQNLTVLAHQLPETFDKGMFTAALGAVVARELGLEREETAAVFIASLAHDVGLLHIAPAILAKTEALAAEEWRAIQSHVVIGQLLLQNVPGLPAGAAQAVLEHHERCDGSGYPLGRTEEQLGRLGQIVALADSLQAIRVGPFHEQGLNLANAVPFLQMNSTTHFYAIYEATYGALKRAGLSPCRFHGEEALGPVARQLSGHAEAVAGVLPSLEGVHAAMQARADGRLGRSLDRLAERVVRMIHSSGLLRPELTHWLRQQAAAPDLALLGELNTIELMQQELRWQLASLRRGLDDYLDKEAGESASVPALRAALEQISGCLTLLDRAPIHH